MPTEISGSTGVNKIQDGTVVTADVNTSNPDLGILTTATNSNVDTLNLRMALLFNL